MLYLAQVTPEDSDTDSRFWLERLPELACECLLKEQESSGESRIYDEIIIDEAQDLLRRSYLDFLDLSLRGGLQDGRWRVFGDFEFQRIYPQHGQLTLDEIDPDGRYPVHGLRVNCRNTLSVAQLACACVGVDPTYCRVLRKSDDVPPQIHAFREPAAQQDLLAGCLDSLHDEGFAWADMAVLSTVADERSAVALLPAERWSQRLERVAQYSAEFDTESVRAAVENPTGHARCATIHRFKGLEARVVVITDVTRLDETVRALLYVGATRAVERLVVLAHKDVAAELRRLSAAWG